MDNYKRARELQESESPSKRQIHIPDILTEIPELPEFFSHITQRGQSRTVWRLPHLSDIIPVLNSEWFASSSGQWWRWELHPCLEGAVVLSLEGPDTPVHVTVDMYLMGRKVDRLSFSFTSETSFELLKRSKTRDKLTRPLIILCTVDEVYKSEDSRDKTGYLGLVNEGTTCYINSLLQTLFHLCQFRRAVYSIPESPLILALQQVFYKLQYAKGPVSTAVLLQSFNWNARDWYIQHDIQEFNCQLASSLGDIMRGTPAEGTLELLFEGVMTNQIRCINVDFVSENSEGFSDLQLNVKGHSDIYDSFRSFVAEERLENENEYVTEFWGRQEARKKVVFSKFPDVLKVHLKRFDYDKDTMALTKVNDYFEFYEELQLSEYAEHPHSSYKLFSVLVHSGRINAGHYFAYICPRLDGQWFKFNDAAVSPVTVEQVLRGSYGGPELEYTVLEKMYLERGTIESDTSAYMLVYINSEKITSIMHEVVDDDIPPQLRATIEEIERERIRQEEIKIFTESICEIPLISFDIVKEWNRPGLVSPQSTLFGVTTFYETNNYYKMSIKKTKSPKGLAKEIKKSYNGWFRLWWLTPKYSIWGFNELDPKLSMINYKLHSDKVIYVETKDNDPVFKRINDEWVFVENKPSENIPTEENKEEESALIFLKWFDGGSLSLFESCLIPVPTSTHAIRNLITSKLGVENINLYLEKSDLETKSTDLTPVIFELNLEENLNLYTSNKGSLGEKYIKLSNGDVFIASKTDTAVTAKEYITEICSDIQITCTLHNKLADSAYTSYSEKILLENNINSEFILKVKPWFKQLDLMNELAGYLNICPFTHFQLFSNRTGTIMALNNPPVTNHNGTRQAKRNRDILSIIDDKNTIFFDLYPYPLVDIKANQLIYLTYLNSSLEEIDQHYFLMSKKTAVKDLDGSAKILNLKYYGEIEEMVDIQYLLLSYPEKIILEKLDGQSSLDGIADNKALQLCVCPLPCQEIPNEHTVNLIQLVPVFQYSETETHIEYFPPFFEVLNNSLTCKEVAWQLKGKFDEKVEAKICDITYFGTYKFQFSVPIRLEESTELFFTKYKDNKFLGIQLRPVTLLSGLRPLS